MAIEFELKFRATRAIQDQLLESLPQGREIAMHTTYYDTPSGALSARYYTLRRRLENGVSVCTLKAPAEGGGRGEWELENPDIETAIEKLCKLGGPTDLPTLTAEGLRAVCGAKFTRTACLVTLPECTVEVALDRGILYGGDREIPLCEVEVELKEGSREACSLYAKLLAARFALEPETGSKFRRDLALLQGE